MVRIRYEGAGNQAQIRDSSGFMMRHRKSKIKRVCAQDTCYVKEATVVSICHTFYCFGLVMFSPASDI